MNWIEIQQDVINLSLRVGEMLLEAVATQKNLVQKSSSVDLVTQYDTAAEEMILAHLHSVYPSHRIIAEESGDTVEESDFCWYIDPIDGTTNFAHGFPHFAVSIALYYLGEPVVAVVYNPMMDECFTATAGGGAKIVTTGQVIPIQVSSADTLLSSLVATGFPYDRHTSPDNNWQQFGAMMRKTQGMRRAGSAALDLAYVAAGRLDGYWEYKLKPWDVAAGILLVTEAGGTVTKIDGSAIELTSTLALIATNGDVHQEFVEILAPFPLCK